MGHDPRFAKGVTVRAVTGGDPRFGSARAKPTSGAPKATKPPPPDVYAPNRCVVLAVDPGAESGWSIITPVKSIVQVDGRARTVNYTIEESGHGKRPDPEIFRRARAHAVRLGLPLMVVGEKWHAGNVVDDPTMTPAVLAGLGAAWGRWDMCRDQAGVPESRVVRCFPEEWRGRVFGAEGRKRYVKSSVWKAMARRYVLLIFGIDATDDQAEAICIGVWAMHSGVIAAKMPKRKAG